MDLLALRWLPLVPSGDGRSSGTLVGEVVPDASWSGAPGFLHGGMTAALSTTAWAGSPMPSTASPPSPPPSVR